MISGDLERGLRREREDLINDWKKYDRIAQSLALLQYSIQQWQCGGKLILWKMKVLYTVNRGYEGVSQNTQGEV